MKKLTKKERNKIYKKCLQNFENNLNSYNYLCGEFSKILFKYNFNTAFYYEIEEILPEFKLFKPKRLRKTTWFRDGDKNQKERKTCLSFCIAMTE